MWFVACMNLAAGLGLRAPALVLIRGKCKHQRCEGKYAKSSNCGFK